MCKFHQSMLDGGEGGGGSRLSQNQWQGMHERDAQRVDLVRDSRLPTTTVRIQLIRHAVSFSHVQRDVQMSSDL